MTLDNVAIAQARDRLREKFLEVLNNYSWVEGRINHMYLDVKGLVTVGLGCLLENVEAALKLPFVYDKFYINPYEQFKPATDALQQVQNLKYLSFGQNQIAQSIKPQLAGLDKMCGFVEKASSVDIQLAYEWVHKQPKGRGPRAYKHPIYNNLKLSNQEIDLLAESKINEKIALIERKLGAQKLYALPLNAQLALLNNVYNTGHLYKDFTQAILDGHWDVAAKECHTKVTADGVYPRNTLVATWLCQLQELEGKTKGFCAAFKDEVDDRWGSYDDLLTRLENFNSKDLESFKKIDQLFSEDFSDS